MPGPLQALRFIHNAIRHEIVDLEQVASAIDTNDSVAYHEVADRYRAMNEFLKDHEHGEETVFFPALEEKAPYVIRAYEIDHRSNDDNMDDLERALDGLTRATDAPSARKAARRLFVSTIALRATMNLHLKKEEEHLLDVADVFFTMPEQGKIVGAMAAHAPDVMPKVMSWIVTRIGTDDRVGLLRVMQAGMPLEAFQGMGKMISGFLPATEWGEVTDRIPELGGPAPVPA